MVLPTQPVTLSVEQIRELNQKLSDMRHDINNQLSTVMAAIEMIRFKPESAARMIDTLGGQPMKISQSLAQFSREFEQAFGIARDK